MVQIINLLLGSNCEPDSIFRGQTLLEHSFTMAFDLNGSRTRASRSGKTQGQISVDGDFGTWPKQPKLNKKTDEHSVSLNDWRDILGALMFDLPPDVPAYGPTFRALLTYFVRRESSGGFQEAQKQSNKQQNWDVQVNLSYLFGLDWRIPQSLQEVRQKEKALETIKREASSGLLGNLVGNLGELRTRLAIAERETSKLRQELANFQVLPEYHELEQEASKLAIRISELTSENTLDLERIETLSSQLTEETPADDSRIVELYQEIGIVLPSLVSKRLEDVQTFHAAIVRNRRIHLQAEIDSARSAIESRQLVLEQADSRRQEIMRTLSTHGALDQYSKLQEELTRQQATLEEIKRKVTLAKQLDSQSNELTIERTSIKQQMTADLEDKLDHLAEAIVIFEDFSKRISDHEGSLVIDPTNNGPEFKVQVEGKESKGIRNMQIFCFDLTLAVLWSGRKANSPQGKSRGPGFLVHDSHLFDGMDSRQVGKAIEMGAEQASKHGFQYIVSINSDQLSSAEFSPSFNPQAFRNPVEITDATETGGIFGMRI